MGFFSSALSTIKKVAKKVKKTVVSTVKKAFTTTPSPSLSQRAESINAPSRKTTTGGTGGGFVDGRAVSSDARIQAGFGRLEGQGVTEEIKPFLSIEGQEQRLEAVRSSPEGQLITDIGLTGAAASPGGFIDGKGVVSIAGKLLKIPGGTKAQSQVSKLGTIGKVVEIGKPVTNTVTKAKTTTWLGGLYKSVKNPTFVVSTLLASVGSYPFAGFIKEEALQTLSFSVRSAINSGDLELADEVTSDIDDLLDPNLTQQILNKIPGVNILNQLNNFFEGARLKNEIDKKIISDLKIQRDTGETEDEKWERVKQDEADQDKENIDFYNEQRKLMVDWEREADIDARDEDARFWREEAAKTRKAEEEDREAIARFWLEYRKEIQKLQDDNRPSNLNFGLL